MDIINRSCLSKALVLLAVNCVLHTQSVVANEWRGDYVSKPGFSEFSPPADSGKYRDKSEDKQWASGSSFNTENRVRYTPRTSTNPWKAHRSSFTNTTITGKRPWGNVPDRKPPASNMKLHDQRFKQWLNRSDSTYRNFSALNNPLSGFASPGMMYSDPLITPSIYPGSLHNGSGYPGLRYPNTGFLPRARFW